MEAERDTSVSNRSETNNTESINEQIKTHFSRKASPLRSSLAKRENRSRSSNAKFVSFITQRRDKKVCNVSDCIQMMQNATEFIKLRTNIRQFRRTFILDSNLSHIHWTPTNKKPNKAKIAIESIKEVRIGRNTELHRAIETYANDLQVGYDSFYRIIGYHIIPGRMRFSIIHGDDYECLDLIAKTPEIAKIWITGLMSLISNNAGICESEPSGSQQLSTLRERWLGSVFDEADIEKSGCLSENKAIELIKQLNPRILLNRVEHEVKEASILNPNESQRGKITRSQFVEIYKLLGVTMTNCTEIIEQYEPCKEARELNHMTVDGFTNYLYNDENFLFDNAHRTVCQKMNQPFSNYFIATSYNTSLIDDQFNEPSNCKGYVTALRRNCRFIEVDIWEPVAGTDENELMVHNRYGSSKLTLSTVLNVINEMAFHTTTYPLFIRLELYLNTEWQIILVDMLQNTFGDRLYQPYNDPINWTKGSRRPTPKDFQKKIILIGGRIEDTEEDTDEVKMRNEDVEEKIDEAIYPLWKINKNCHLLSSSEQNCLKMMQNSPAEFAQTAKDYMMLVTPNASRFDSSNMNPQEFWNYGVQMVSINYQTMGLIMDLQRGKFSENGGCGYVLKPSMMREEELYTPGDMLPIPPQILYLRILSGQQLPRPRGSTAKGNSTDPYVVVEIFGSPTDCTEERTRTVKNGANPSFDESFQFEITVPEMALIRFLVLDDDFIDDDFIGQYTIPFECLKTKPCKRGMSVKRKNTRIVTGVKSIGIKSVDEYFKQAIAPLAVSIEMRGVLESALMKWRNDCGIGPAGSIRQGLRLMLTRTKTAALNASPPNSPYSSNNPTKLVDNKPVSDDRNAWYISYTITKTFDSMSELLDICAKILVNTDPLLTKLENATKRITECNDELSQLCTNAGLHGVKATRACENFAWNVFDVGCTLGILSEKSTAEICGKRFSRSSTC
ncbi:Phosphoinositide phospholipase C [Dirofilaria immitis]|nr:Phosphoinositide phospholipase C [Dirofilaria immitis]